jgi:hypothetical protein
LPGNHKKTNHLVGQINTGGNCNAVTVTPITGDGFKFPHGLYTRSYLSIHEQEHFVRNCIDWIWKPNDGIGPDKEMFKVILDDMGKAKSTGKQVDGIDLEFQNQSKNTC